MEKPQLIYDYSKCFKSRENNINPEFKSFVPTGNCCCNCKYQIKLTCHPWNKNFGKGSMTQICGYACIATEEINYDKTIGFFTDNKHGMCELYMRKEIQFKDNEKLFL